MGHAGRVEVPGALVQRDDSRARQLPVGARGGDAVRERVEYGGLVVGQLRDREVAGVARLEPVEALRRE